MRRLESKAPARRRGHSEAWSSVSGDAGTGYHDGGTIFVYNVLQQVSHAPWRALPRLPATSWLTNPASAAWRHPANGNLWLSCPF